ncbi:MAG: hypothetical protein U1F43_27340 [Myxococcota bacterium]
MGSRAFVCVGALVVVSGCIDQGAAVDTAPPPPQVPSEPSLEPWAAAASLRPAPAVSVDPPDASAPAIVAVEGEEVAPQTVVHLGARWPGSESDAVVSWSWSVVQPAGSVSLFYPSSVVATPTLEVDVAGQYDFTVDMRSASGQSASARFMLFVVPDSAIHVELLWHTPGDTDESDTGLTLGGNSRGSDVDLHTVVRHADEPPSMAGLAAPFFYNGHDCYWLNPSPPWAGGDDARTPQLDRDDTDGAGPENMNLEVIAPGDCYTIGVHYWDDWGYGTSTATVRVYVMGELEYAAETELGNHDLWVVGELCGDDPRLVPALDCSEAGCAPVVAHQFPVPVDLGTF